MPTDDTGNTGARPLTQEQAEKAARQARLEAQLRANLQRRKEQVRARKTSDTDGTSGAGT